MVREVVFIGVTSTFFYFEDYVQSLMDAAKEMGLPCSVEMWTPHSTLRPGRIHVFLQTIPDPILATCPVSWYPFLAMLNTEQLTRKEWMVYLQRIHDRGITVLDYSVENVLLSGCSHHYYVPLQDMGHPYTEKSRGSCMIQGTVFPARKEVFSLLSEATNVVGFGRTRDHLLFQHKVIVNVHANSEYNVHEHIRTDRCIHQGMIVVTEPSVHTDRLPLRPYMVVEERSKIPARVGHILKHYDEVYAEIFGNMDRSALRQQAREEWRNVFQVLQHRIG